MLCPLFFRLPALPHAWAALALLAGSAAVASNPPNPPPVAPSSLTAAAPAGATHSAAPNANGQEPVLAAARAWVAQQQGQPASAVQFAALDSRLRVTPCAQPLQMDYPFSQSRETVRVRCPGQTPWQLFLRVVAQSAPGLPGPAPQAGVASAAPAPSAATRQVLVARRLIQRGSLLDPGMLEVVERPTLGLDPLAVGSLKDVDMAEAQRDIAAGTVLRSYDIKRALMVRKGQAAMLTVGQGTGFQVTVRVEAQQDGHMGEQVRLKNTESGRLLSGVVVGPNAVRGLQNNF